VQWVVAYAHGVQSACNDGAIDAIPIAGRFKPEHPVSKLEGNYDVFGDGSVTILATPGHTPGHQSLLVKLPKTGAIVLSGERFTSRATGKIAACLRVTLTR
jgi:glyoxylase-like metal-dependent hydrolase (beta-lactamase superfamily II)